jgi:hypothetical protein
MLDRLVYEQRLEGTAEWQPVTDFDYLPPGGLAFIRRLRNKSPTFAAQ